VRDALLRSAGQGGPSKAYQASKFNFCQKIPKNNKKERKDDVVQEYFRFLPKNNF
jgi:hypothetical protein